MLIEVATPQKVKFFFDSDDIYWIQEGGGYCYIFLKPQGHQIQIAPNSKIEIYDGKEWNSETTNNVSNIDQIISIFKESKNRKLLHR